MLRTSASDGRSRPSTMRNALYRVPLAALLSLPMHAVLAAAPDPSLAVLEEVTVTANRRSETANNIAMSIAAISQDSLDEKGIKNVTDLDMVVPGLNVTNRTAGVANFSIRGIAANTGAATTAVYLDDTSLTKRSNLGVNQNNGAPLPILYDLERVEVLKGPQGTLYGGSSEGGTIRVITATPSLTDYSGRVRAEGSSLSHGSSGYELAGAFGGPIVTDKLGVRLSALVRHNPGYVDIVNFNNGALFKKDADQGDDLGLHLALLYKPSDRFSASYSAYYAENKSDGGPNQPTKPLPKGFTISTAQVCNNRVRPPTQVGSFTPAAVACPANGVSTSSVWVRPAATYGFDYLDGYNSIQPTDGTGRLLPNKTRTLVNSLALQYDFDAVSVKAISSYIDDKTSSNALAAGAITNSQSQTLYPAAKGLPLFAANYQYAVFSAYNKRHGFQEELRVSSRNDDAALTWVAGAYFSRATDRIQYTINGSEEALYQAFWGISQATRYGFPDTNPMSTLDAIFTDKESAAFAEVNYKVTPRLKVTGGLRYSKVGLDFSQLFWGIIPSRTITDPYSLSQGVINEKPLTPKAGVQFQLAPDQMLYATASKGFRAGGVNTAINPTLCAAGLTILGLAINDIPQTYGSDSVWSYELGGKFRLDDGRLQVNVAAYRINWNDIQVSVTPQGCGQGWAQNGGTASSTGGDLEIQYRPIQPLMLSLTAGYGIAKYTEDVIVSKAGATTTTKLFNAGDRLDVPQTQFTATTQYDFQVMERPSYLRLDYNYQGSYQSGGTFGTNAYNPFVLRKPVNDVLNLRVGMTIDKFDVNVFATNLTDAHDPIGNAGNGITQCTAAGGESCTAFTGYTPIVTQPVQRPRTIGLQAQYKF